MKHENRLWTVDKSFIDPSNSKLPSIYLDNGSRR